MNKINTSKGYAGLLGLLITAIVITFIVWKMYGGNKQNKANPIEVGQNAIQSAEEVKKTLEQQSQQTNSEMQ